MIRTAILWVLLPCAAPALAIQQVSLGTITGVVIDPAGKPLRGATVTVVLEASSRADKGKNYKAVHTDKSGRFRASGLTTGTWRVHWEAKGYYPEQEQIQAGFFVTPVDQAVKVSGDVQEVRLVCRPVSVQFGQIIGTDGKPVRSQLVWQVPPHSFHFGSAPSQLRCDARGLYQIDYRGAGKYAVGIYHPDGSYAPVAVGSLKDGERTRRDFRLARRAVVYGEVVGPDGRTPYPGARVSAEDARGYAVLPFRVEMRRARRDIMGGMSLVNGYNVEVKRDVYGVRTDAEGRFRIEIDPDTDCLLQAQSGNRYTSEERKARVRLGSGKMKSAVVIVLDQQIGR